MPHQIVGWLVNQDDRQSLLVAFPAAYPRIIAHHVTLKSGATPDFPLPREKEGFIVGIADDGKGVQALVVEIGGTTKRPDGSTWHITWSLAETRKPVESNDVIREAGWKPVPRRKIRLEPTLFS
jgi:hypothetical protein